MTAHGVPNPAETAFWNETNLEVELRRVGNICHGCRLCFNLCPSFRELFRRIDEKGEAVENLTRDDFKQVVLLCYDCKLCFPKCPYTPPHNYQLDFPRLMVRARALWGKRGLRERFLEDPDRLALLGVPMAPLANWVNQLSITRRLFEKIMGIHHRAVLPTFARQTFAAWHRRRMRRDGARAGANGKVVLFYTCLVNYHEPEVGRAAVQVLEHNDVEVVCPPQRCCGMPYLDTGNLPAAVKRARYNVERLVPYVRAGYTIVSPGPSCSLMLRQEYPHLLSSPEAREVASHTQDLCEYLMKLNAQGKLRRDWTPLQEVILYHHPCHLQVQNIGRKSWDLLALISEKEVGCVTQCSGHDGTWSMKREYHELSHQIGGKLYSRVQESLSSLVACDCSLAQKQITQGTGKKAVHPILLVARAYGLGGEGSSGETHSQ